MSEQGDAAPAAALTRRGLRRLRGASGAYLLSDGLLLVVALAQGLVLARVLGPSSFGVLSVILAGAALVFSVLDPRAGEALSRYVSEHLSRADRQGALAVVKAGYVLDVVLVLVGSAVAAAALFPLTRLVLGESTDPDAGVILPVVLLAASAAPVVTARAALVATGRLRLLTRVQHVMVAARMTVVVALLVLRPDLQGCVGLLLAAALLELVLLTVLVLRVSARDLGGSVLRASLSPLAGRRRSMLRFVAYADASSLVGVLVKQLDVVLVGSLGGAVEAGYYRLARQISTALSTPAQSLQNLAYPRLSRAFAAGDDSDLRQILRRATAAGFALAALTLLTVPFVGVLVREVAGDSYTPATTATALLVLGAAAASAFLVFRPVYLATGNAHVFLAIVSTTGVLGLVSFAFVSAEYGATGVALARTLVVSLLGNLLGWIYLRRWLARRGQAGTLETAT